MMKKFIPSFLLITLILLGSLSAQSFVGKLNPNPVINPDPVKISDLKILAVMVEFQPDQDDATFGDGTFGSIYTQDYGNTIIDPLPHDANYFSDHLTFAQNYFSKVSNGNLSIDFIVLNDVVVVDKVMREYSPNPNSETDFSSLADFAAEVWTKVDASNPDIDFSQYDLFTIFHAGVGRDIDVPGSIGNDRDLPSVYLGLKTLREAIDNSFEGFLVDDGNFKVTNTMILPSTESRELEAFGEISLIELSTNGLIVASIASHLGLPDLFNTETGLSSIGRFGLMDGQSIFTFGGLFPPEPSPWEKMYLGWIDPVEVSNVNGKINLTTEEISTLADTTYIKIPINSNEYYLVENRSRDAKRDGATITYKVDGEIKTINFDKDYDTFISFNIDTLSGVIIDVDEFDWAVPAFDRNDGDLDSFTDVGIVIWHIDEKVISENIESNTINNDKFNRGVRVVEADGIDDIGEEFQTIFGDFVIGEGSKEDTWYSSNPSELYRNRFDATSSPATVSNSGANSLISFSDFSEIETKMSFNLHFGDANTQLVSTLNIQSIDNIEWTDAVSFDNSANYIFSNKNELIVVDESGSELINSQQKIDHKPAVVSSADQIVIVSTNDRNIDITTASGTSSNIDSARFTTSPVITNIGENIEFYLGNELGYVNLYEFTKFTPVANVKTSLNKAFDDAVRQIATNGSFVAAISESSYWDSEVGRISLEASPLQISIAQNNNELYSIVLLSNKKIIVLNDNEIISTIEYPASDFAIGSFSLGDLKGDGSTNIVVNYYNGLSIYNLLGSFVLTIPYEQEDIMPFPLTPLLVDLDGDDLSDLLTFSASGRINAYSGLTGEVLEPYPISYSIASAHPLIFNNNNSRLLVVDDSKKASVWNISGSNSKIDWGNRFGNSGNTAFVGEPQTINQLTSFFPKSEAYNWPNPVYGNNTYFHFFVGEDSNVEINIFDLAGDRVDKLTKSAVGGFENEIVWDVSNIESGVYLAHLNVKSSSGNSDYKIIKVAVIK
jgi:hypothetical protein